jgi:hypothetical protein
MAHDQRYCVECGTRRGPLPSRVAATATATVTARDASSDARRGAAGWLPSFGGWVPTRNSAAAAVLGMLGFGALVGSLAGSGVAGGLSPAVVVAVSPAAPAASRSPAASDDAGGSGGASRTITVTDASPAATPPPAPVDAGGAGTTAATTTPSTPAPPGQVPLSSYPPIKHVFLITLADEGYSQTFGSADKYFSTTLPGQGELLQFYYAVTAGELANEIGMISGQGPTPQTAADCPAYSDFAATGSGTLGQALGSGCVYPASTPSLADQLSGHNRGGWRAYIQDPDPVPTGQPTTCRHPALNAGDPNTVPPATDPYTTWSNPFVYFHSVIDGNACAADDVSFTQLSVDLEKESTTPALSYIVPSPCANGSQTPCATTAAAGLAPAETFLRLVVAEIESSPAYQDNGLIAITFDQAPQTGPDADATACCDPQTFPNLPAATIPSTTTMPGATTPATTTTPTTLATTPTPTTTATTPTSPVSGGETAPTGGGGQVGLLLLSPYVKAGTLDTLDYFNHFSLLGTIEKLFKLPRLGYASDPALPLFEPSVFFTKLNPN